LNFINGIAARHRNLVTTWESFTHGYVAGIIRTRFTAYTLTHMFASLSTSTRCLTSSSFCLIALKVLFVTTGVCFLYPTPAFDTFTRLTTKPWTWVTTIEIPGTAVLTCYTVGIATARHFKRVVSCAAEILHHHLLAHVLDTLLGAFSGTLVTARQRPLTLVGTNKLRNVF